MADPLLAPQAQTMSLLDLTGVVVRQETQAVDMIMTVVGGPYEKENVYVVSALPKGTRVARENPDNSPGVWHPTGEELKAQPPLLVAKEDSSLGWRMFMSLVGCLNLRAYKMPFLAAPAGGEAFRLERPYKCGGWLCNPLELTVVQGGTVLGKVQEDFRFLQCCFACTTFAKVVKGTGAEGKHVYTLRTSECCFGRVNNCCGATCCTDRDLIIDILAPDGKLVATIQKVYAPSKGAGACLRCAFEVNNYILEFPPEASEEERTLLMGALMHVDYQVFQRQGGESNSHSD